MKSTANAPTVLVILRWKEKIYLGAEYPKRHPLQTETAKQVWDALTQGGFEPLYDDGCAWSLHCSKEYSPEHGGCETFEK